MSLKDRAIDQFFACIKDGKIKSGTTLSQSELSETLDVSLSPLREALKLLEFQGFVRILPRSGVEIVESDMQHIKDCFQLRRLLEAAGAQRFVEFERPDRLKPILMRHKALLARIEAKEPEQELQEELARLDIELHDILMSSLQNNIIMRIYETNQDRITLFRLDSISLTHHSLACTCSEHIDILEAALAGNVQGTLDAMEHHLTQTMHRAMSI